MRFAHAAVVPLLVVTLILPRAAAADVISVGAQSGAQIFFNDTLTRVYNFGITTTGGSAGLTFDRVDVNLKGGNAASNVEPVIIQVFNGLGGTGTVLANGTFPAGSLTSQFEFRQVSLTNTIAPGDPITLPTGGYSVKLTTANVGNYFIKDGKLTLQNPSGTATLSNTVWIEDSNTQGSAGSTSGRRTSPARSRSTTPRRPINTARAWRLRRRPPPAAHPAWTAR